MDKLFTWKSLGYWKARQLLVLLCLAGSQLRPVVSTHTEKETSEPTEDTSNEGLEVAILGPDYVTVSVPCSFECSSNCPSSSCTYSIAVDGQDGHGQGNVLAFTLQQWTDSMTLTCTARDDDHVGSVVTVTKKLQILAGPANVSISGSDMINPTASYSYSCHVYCRPSCSYAWKIDDGPWIGGQGNVIGVTTRDLDVSKALTCKATNIVSGLWVAKTRYVTVASGPSGALINGPDSIKVAKNYKFACVADCMPSCRYRWSVDGHSLKGSEIEVMVERQLKSITLQCEVQNTVSQKSAMVSKTTWIGDHSMAAHAEKTMALLTCALILSAVIPA